MFLKEGRRYPFGHGAFEGFDDDLRFMLADSEKQNSTGCENRAETHREGLCRDVVFAKEVTCDSTASDRIERAQPSTASPGRERFIETDMTIHFESLRYTTIDPQKTAEIPGI